MKPFACAAVTALCLSLVPQTASATTLTAFAGVEITIATTDGSQAVGIYQRQTTTNVQLTEGDGTGSVGFQLVTGGPLITGPSYTSATRNEAVATVGSDGSATFVREMRERFTIYRSLDEDREIMITLASLPGLSGLFLQAFGTVLAEGSIGAASATVTLERTDFEGTLFSRSVFQNLGGTGPGDIVNATDNLFTPVSLAQVVEKREVGEPDMSFVLTVRVEASTLVEPAEEVSVIPLPAAGWLLVTGLGGLFLARRPRRGRSGGAAQ